jgi:hypothetical protein
MKQFEALTANGTAKGGVPIEPPLVEAGTMRPFQSIAVVASWAANQLRGD